MSASAQKIPPSSPAEERESKLPWVIMSVAFHALVLGWLIYMVPVRELTSSAEEALTTRNPAAENASANLVKEVAEQIEATQSDEIRSRVEELQATENMLAELQEQKASEFTELSKEIAAEAPKTAAEAQAKADEAQAKAEQAQTEALQLAGELKALTEAPSPDATTQTTPAQIAETKAKMAAAQEAAKTAQAAATAAQTTAAQQMGFRDDAAFKEAKTSQEAAAAAQLEANRKQDEAAAKLGDIEARQRNAQKAAEAAGQAKNQVDTTQSRVEQLKQSISKQEETLQQSQSRIDELKKKPDAAKGGTAKEIEKASAGLVAGSKKLETTKTDLGKTETKLADLQTKSSVADAEAAKQSNAASAAPDQARAAQEEALKTQQSARAAQAKAQSTLAAAPAAENPSIASATTGEASRPVPLEGKNFSELYDAAVQTEKQIAEQFQSIRATQVAVQRKIPISEARKFVKIATPARAEYQAAEGSIDDAAALEKQNAAMEDALQQVDSMVALSRSMAFQATNDGSTSSAQGLKVTGAQMQAQANQAEQLAGLATESEGKVAVDLTGMMKEIENGEGTHGAHHGQGGEHGTGSGPDQGNGAGSAQPEANGFGPGTAGDLVFPGKGAINDSIPGRKVHAGTFGSGSNWMFVDTWYIIGPFPNPQRRNIETKFPPESIVDLDASYPVEGQNLRWQFVQTASAGFKPPQEREYAIYYGYTTLWFDDPQDLWIATGSDDFSKLWINDMLVWASGSVQKNWKPNEGYRRVHFKKGLNRVLFRLENGHNSCMFSLMLNMQTVNH